MKLSEYAEVQSWHYDYESLTPSTLKNKEPRTLVYWYTLDRNSFHCYLDDKWFITVLIYDNDYDIKETQFFWPDDKVNFNKCTPNKRSYPECCDSEFIKEMLKAWVDPNFTTFNETREAKQFYWHTT